MSCASLRILDIWMRLRFKRTPLATLPHFSRDPRPVTLHLAVRRWIQMQSIFRPPPPQNHQLFLVKHRAKFVAVFAASLARSCPVVFVPQNTHNKYTANRQRPESGSFANCNRSCKKLPMNNRPCVVNMNEWAHEKQPLLYDSTLKIA